MASITSFGDVQNVLRPLYDNARTKYSLDNTQRLMAHLDNPQDTVRIVHVAGTSGKTSTSYYISGLLIAAGKKVGLTVSPHIDEINERVQINGVSMDETEFCEEFSIFYDLLKKSKVLASYFECMVAFAFWEFERQKVDYAVVEVGLGGLLDGTNIVRRTDKVCVITDIGLDHTEILGDTLAKIALQKAGIINQNNHVFMYRQSDEITEAIANFAHSKAALMHIVPDASHTVPASDLPRFQQRNLWLAAYVANYVLKRDYGSELDVRHIESACKTYIPARMEVVQYKNKTVIIDGAHNAQKLQTLFGAVHDKFPNQTVAAVIGFVEGDVSRIHEALGVISDNAQHLIATSFYGEKDYPKRSVATDQIIAQCHELGFNDIEPIDQVQKAFQALLNRPEDVLVVIGSFYLLNHIRPLLRTEDL